MTRPIDELVFAFFTDTVYVVTLLLKLGVFLSIVNPSAVLFEEIGYLSS